MKNEEWERQLPYIKELADLKVGAEKFFKGVGNLKEAFRARPGKLVCIDEGTAMKKTEDGVFPLAGLGILLPAKNEEERLEKAAKIVIDSGLNKIESHPGCGAVKRACERDEPGKEPTPQEIEAKAKDWAEKLAKKVNSKGKEVAISHISAKEMTRPAEFHNAVVLYYDGTGKFNPGYLENKIPQGFVISRGGLEKPLGEEAKDYCGQELGIACSIALGEHGFGRKKFTEETPFIIAVVGKNDDHLGVLKKEAEEALKNNPDFLAGRIKVDGFVAPAGS